MSLRRGLALAHPSFRALPHFAALSQLLGKSHAERETRWMTEHITGRSRAEVGRQLDSGLSAALSATELARLDAMVHSRAIDRQPLQYLLGSVNFLGLPLTTRAPVLIPRPETESMLAWTVARWRLRDYRKRCPHLSVQREDSFEEIMQCTRQVKDVASARPAAPASSASSASALSAISDALPPLRVLDLCTGSGNIALSLFHHLPYDAHVLGVDINPQALELAKDNLEQLQRRAFWKSKEQPRGSCSFAHLDLLAPASADSSPSPAVDAATSPQLHALLHPPAFVDALARLSAGPVPFSPVNLIVSNPPYIPMREFSDLQPEVRDWEDVRALISGDEGLDVHDSIVRGAVSLLQSPLQSGILGSSRSAVSSPAVADTSEWDVPELVMELGSESQMMKLAVQLQALGFHHVTMHHDAAGLPRFIAAARRRAEAERKLKA